MASEFRLYRLIVHLLLALVCVSCYIGLLHFVSYVIPASAQLPVMGSIAALVLVFFMAPMRQGVEYAVNKALYGVSHSYLQVSAEAVRRLSALDRESLVEVMTRQVPQAMQVQEAGICLLDEQNQIHWIGGNLKVLSPLPLPLSLPPVLLRRLKKGQPLSQPLNGGELLGVGSHIRWLIPLTVADDLQGLWVIGPQRDDRSFSLLDQQLIQVAAQSAALVIKDMALLASLREQIAQIQSHQAELTNAYHRLTLAKEEERSQLAAELHDGILQSLCGLELAMGAMAQPQEGQPAMPYGTKQLDTFQEQIKNIVSQTRALCRNLHSTALEKMGLATSLRTLVAEMHAAHGLVIHLEVPPGRFARDVERAIYGIIREALTNVARHAQATVVHVRLYLAPHAIALSVQDNGRGFVVEQVGGQRLGLVGMRARAVGLGGTLVVQSHPDKGTLIQATIPL